MAYSAAPQASNVATTKRSPLRQAGDRSLRVELTVMGSARVISDRFITQFYYWASRNLPAAPASIV
jgi:hypothetical protein